MFVAVVEKNNSTIKDAVLNLNVTVVTTLEVATMFVRGVPGRILLVNKLHAENFIVT
jgi:hypothetical protein